MFMLSTGWCVEVCQARQTGRVLYAECTVHKVWRHFRAGVLGAGAGHGWCVGECWWVRKRLARGLKK